MGVDHTTLAYFNNQEGGGFRFRDRADNPIWISGDAVGINSPFMPLHSLMVYNNNGHQALQVASDNITIGDVDNNTAGNYFYVDNTAATPKFMFYGANTAFGTLNSPTSTVFIQGSTNLSTTYALRIQNSSGTQHFAVRDDGRTGIGLTSGAPTSTLDVSGSFALSGQASVNATAVITMTADQSTIFVNGAGATVTLPAASGCRGRVIIIKQTVANIGTSIITSGGNIEGGATFSLGPTAGVRKSIVVTSDGTNWWIVSQY